MSDTWPIDSSIVIVIKGESPVNTLIQISDLGLFGTPIFFICVIVESQDKYKFIPRLETWKT